MKRKKTIMNIIVIILLLFSIIGITIKGLNKDKDYIDELVNKYNPQGAAVVIIENGVITKVKNYGYANTEKNLKLQMKLSLRLHQFQRA